jgi:YVTN family beta-propeller protein
VRTPILRDPPSRAGRRLLVLSLLSLGAFLGPPRSPAAAERDPRAVEVAERMMQAMGGRDAYESVRLVRFDFEVVRDGESLARYYHWWDRGTGRYRLEGTTPEGEPFRVLFDVDTRDGQVWVGRERLEGEEADRYLERAYGRFINDSYWLLMPWKWLDPGVNLAYEGEREVDGTAYDVVRLSFGDVGLTPNDRYWGYVSKETGLMERWEYVLQKEDGSPGDAEPTAYAWEDWQETQVGVKLATVKRRLSAGPEVLIRFPVLFLAANAPEEELNPILRPHSPLAPPEEATGTPPEEAGVTSVLVVLNKSDHTAALVDPTSLEVLRLVPTGVAPHEGVASPDGRTLYVADYGGVPPGHTITVIDVPTGEVLRTVDLGEHRGPHGLAIGPEGSLFVTTEVSRSLLRLSAGDLSIEKVYRTGQDITHMVALTPDAKRAFTANIGSGTVSAIDVESGEGRTIETGEGPEGIAVTPDGRECWVAHRNDDNVVVLDTESLETLATLETGRFPIRVECTPDGGRVLVSCAMSNEMIVFDRAERKEVGRVELEEVPIGIQITPDGSRAFVANTQADEVTVVDLGTLEVMGSFSPGHEPDGMAWAAWE